MVWGKGRGEKPPARPTAACMTIAACWREDAASPQAEPDPSLVSLINSLLHALIEAELRPNLRSFTRSGRRLQ